MRNSTSWASISKNKAKPTKKKGKIICNGERLTTFPPKIQYKPERERTSPICIQYGCSCKNIREATKMIAKNNEKFSKVIGYKVNMQKQFYSYIPIATKWKVKF